MESYSIEAILSASDKGFTSAMKGAEKTLSGLDSKYEGAFQDKSGRWRAANGRFMTMKEKSEMLGKSFDNLDGKSKKTGTSIMDIAKGAGVFKLVEAGVSMVTSSVGGAIDRFDTLKKYPNIMKQLGYSTDEVNTSMTKMKDGIDGLPTRLDEIVANTQSLAMATGSLDKGTDSAISLNNAFLASGASTDEASRGLTQYTQMLGKGKVDMASWNTLTDTMGLSLEQVAKSFGFTGESVKTDLYAALQDGTVTFDEFNDKMIEMYNTGTKGADMAAANSKGIATSIKNLRTAVTTGIEKVIDEFNRLLGGSEDFNAIAANIDKIKPVISKTFEAIVKAVGPTLKIMKQLMPVIVALTSAFVAYRTALGISSLITSVSNAMTVMKVAFAVGKDIKLLSFALGNMAKTSKLAAAGQAILNTVMSLTPFTLIVAAIVLLVAGFLYLWNTSESFRNFWINLWETIKIGVGVAVDWIIEKWGAMSSFFSDMWTGIQEAPGKAADFLKEKWSNVQQWFMNVWDNVKTYFSETWDNIVNMFEPYITGITSTFEPLITWFGSLWGRIQEVSAAAWEIIKSVIMGPILFLIDLITGDFDQLKEDISMIWNTIKENASIIWESIKQFFVDTFNAIVDTSVNIWNSFLVGLKKIWNGAIRAGKDVWNMFKSWFINLVTDTKDKAIRTWENLKQGTIDKFNALVDGAKQAWENLKQSVKNTVDKVVDIFDKIKDIDLLEAGKAIIDGFIKGLKEKWEAGKEFISGIGDWIRDHKGPISYDRRLLIPAGNAIIDGLNKGLSQEFDTVKNTVNGMNNYFKNTAFDADFDINSNVNGFNEALKSSDMSLNANSELTLGESNKPANIYLNVGNRTFAAFVSDISAVQAIETDMDLQT